jgi:hypothetical protein
MSDFTSPGQQAMTAAGLVALQAASPGSTWRYTDLGDGTMTVQLVDALGNPLGSVTDTPANLDAAGVPSLGTSNKWGLIFLGVGAIVGGWALWQLSKE